MREHVFFGIGVIVEGEDDLVTKPAPPTNAEGCRYVRGAQGAPTDRAHDPGPNADENRSLVNVNKRFSSHPACPRL